jgi:hypothetical protein
MFISGVNNTGDKKFSGADKFIGGVVDTSFYSLSPIFLISDVIDTGDKFIPLKNDRQGQGHQ